VVGALVATATPLSSVVILVAMAEEARPLIEALSFQPLPGAFDPLPMQAYEARLKRLQVRLVLNGEDPRYGVQNVGTQPATLAAQAAIQAFRPDLLINAGTAGGFASRGAKIGTVYLSAGAFKYHDRRIPLPGYEAYGIGSYPALEAPALARALSLPTGIVSTGNSLELIERDYQMLERNGAVAKEMEAAAIAWVAGLHGVPFLALKSVTNLLDHAHASEAQFLQNLDLAVANMTGKLLEALRFLDGKCLEDLNP